MWCHGCNDGVVVGSGGACSFTEFEETFEKELGITTIKTNDCLFVTPLGIAWNEKV